MRSALLGAHDVVNTLAHLSRYLIVSSGLVHAKSDSELFSVDVRGDEQREHPASTN